MDKISCMKVLSDSLDDITRLNFVVNKLIVTEFGCLVSLDPSFLLTFDGQKFNKIT